MSHAVHYTPAPPGFVPHPIAHHFDSAEQEYQSAKFGFWLFLATEILLFGGIFAAYFWFHAEYPETFRQGGQQLNWKLGALNTIVLLISSYTMAMGVRCAQVSDRKRTIVYLTITALCALGFLVVKYFEYSHKIHYGLLPGSWFGNAARDVHGVMAGTEFPNLFFSFYWTMTGIHGFHVLVGAILIGWLILRARKGHFHEGYYTPVDLVGLYWHIVDLIWIFLFPLLYLVP
jgi:cytochrome c oxidase subunit 3